MNLKVETGRARCGQGGSPKGCGRAGAGHVCFFSRRISEGEDRPLGAGGAGRETARDVDPGWERGSRRAGRGIQRKARRKTEGELEAVEEGKGRRFPFLASAPPAARPGSRRIAPACAPRIPLERGREGAAGWGRALRAPGRGGGRPGAGHLPVAERGAGRSTCTPSAAALLRRLHQLKKTRNAQTSGFQSA